MNVKTLFLPLIVIFSVYCAIAMPIETSQTITMLTHGFGG
ncbi:hypothetical protein QO009_000973 [Brevibacillus aydinogluensis]|jgi:hypothetical protein|uniref:Uncharacterized protein n=1 Tax=Brevibacillus aydinogluensis TaxID=927786 RepID=A0AA48M9Y1_9BACL|nr:hypothetical protein [Brevibacillus aydinogluensis]CAJ1002349.1 hypothetical protein BSPP4475_08480 [Brevibacillus aydinogluensis]